MEDGTSATSVANPAMKNRIQPELVISPRVSAAWRLVFTTQKLGGVSARRRS
jgi:hypothetical protein